MAAATLHRDFVVRIDFIFQPLRLRPGARKFVGEKSVGNSRVAGGARGARFCLVETFFAAPVGRTRPATTNFRLFQSRQQAQTRGHSRTQGGGSKTRPSM